MSNESGHYQPDGQKLSNALAVLDEEYGIPVRHTVVDVFDFGTNRQWNNVTVFWQTVPPQ